MQARTLSTRRHLRFSLLWLSKKSLDSTLRSRSRDVTDDDVNEIIEVFRKQQGSVENVERAAEEGDTVVIDFVGTRDGEAFEGGSGDDLSLELGSGRMIPGFEDGISGMSAGDKKSLDLTFPDDYQQEDLQGAAVQIRYYSERSESDGACAP